MGVILVIIGVVFVAFIFSIFSVGGRSDDDTDILDLRECDIIEGENIVEFRRRA